jgi:hypothetical protein
MRIQKVKEACYCKCKLKKKTSNKSPSPMKKTEEKVETTPPPQLSKYKKKKIEIVYESDESILSKSNEVINETNSLNNSSNQDDENETNKCECICHGTYSNNLLQTVTDIEIQKVKKYKEKIFLKYCFFNFT